MAYEWDMDKRWGFQSYVDGSTDINFIKLLRKNIFLLESVIRPGNMLSTGRYVFNSTTTSTYFKHISYFHFCSRIIRQTFFWRYSDYLYTVSIS